jgi:CRP-like cAMP-binding protein
MHTDLILANVANHIQLDAPEADFFVSLLEPRSLTARQIILAEGSVCRFSIFVNKGCLKGFTTDANGFEHILNFAPAGWWIADFYSLITQDTGHLNISATAVSEVLLLSKNNQEVLYEKVPKFERFFRLLTEKSLVSYQQRVLDGMSLSAELRYQHFKQKYPMLVHDLPQKEIASYIGVTPEFFSKMRNRLLRQ